MKTTAYFDFRRQMPDRKLIRDEWIERAIISPARKDKQSDGRLRIWAKIPEAGGRWLRVIVLADGVTVHNAFFDRSFKETTCE